MILINYNISFLVTMNNNSNYTIYWKHVDIFYIIWNRRGLSQWHLFILYCIYVIHIHTKSAFLHLHFLSSQWAVAFTVAKSFVHAMSCHIQLIIFPYITKRWWYCRCGLWACSSDICSSYFFRRSKVWSILHHGLVGPSSE